MKSKTKSVNKKKSKIENQPKKSNGLALVKRALLLILAVGVLTFNVLVKIDVKAENSSESITIENLLKAHNDYRKSQGVGELKLNNLLNISAKSKGDIMLSTDCWSHYCPPGKSPWDFFDNANYEYIYAGENLGEGYYTIDSLMQAWINSKTHRENIVKSEFTEVGFAIIYGDYLNNPNNVLVVAHFGSRASSADVFSAQNPLLEITSPQDNYTATTESLDITGNVSGLDNVRVFNNNTLSGSAQISGGIFTYRLEKLSEGKNTIWADGSSSTTSLNSNQINVTYTAPTSNDLQNSNFISVSSTDNILSISPQNKNLVNLIFLAILAVIFLVDIILVSRTVAITSAKSFSHYHLALVMLVALIILIGGFAGQIQNGISV